MNEAKLNDFLGTVLTDLAGAATAALVRIVERVPSVLAADLRVNHYGRGRLTPESPTDDLHFIALRDFERQIADRLVLVAGAWPDAGEALVEPAAAARYGLTVGDTLFYRDLGNRERPLRLSGIARLSAALSADITGIPLVFVPDSVIRELVPEAA